MAPQKALLTASLNIKSLNRFAKQLYGQPHQTALRTALYGQAHQTASRTASTNSFTDSLAKQHYGRPQQAVLRTTLPNNVTDSFTNSFTDSLIERLYGQPHQTASQIASLKSYTDSLTTKFYGQPNPPYCRKKMICTLREKIVKILSINLKSIIRKFMYHDINISLR